MQSWRTWAIERQALAYAPAGRADALRWLFFLSGHISPAATPLGFNRIAAKVFGIPADGDAVARGEKALPGVIEILEGRLATNKWLLGNDFTLVECAYCPMLNLIEKASFSLGQFPKVESYLNACRSRQAWKETPKAPGL